MLIHWKGNETIKNFYASRDTIKTAKDKTGIKYWQIIYLIRVWYPAYTKNSYN